MKETFENKIKKQLEQELDNENLIVSETLIQKTLEKIKTAEQQKKDQKNMQQERKETQQKKEEIQQGKEKFKNNIEEKKKITWTKKHKRKNAFISYKFLFSAAAVIVVFLFRIKTLNLDKKAEDNNNYKEISGIKESYEQEIQSNESSPEESIKENSSKYGTSEGLIKNESDFSKELEKGIDDSFRENSSLENIISFTISTERNTVEVLKDSEEEKEIRKVINSIIKVDAKEECNFLESTSEFGEKIGEIIEKRKNELTITYKFYDTAYIIIEEIKLDHTKIESIGKTEDIEYVKRILEQN